MRRLVLVLLLVLPLPLDLAVRAQAPAPPQPLRTAGDRPLDVERLALLLVVDLPKKSVDAHATLEFRTLRKLRTVRLDAVEFTVSEVKLWREGKDTVVLRFSHDGTHLDVEFP